MSKRRHKNLRQRDSGDKQPAAADGQLPDQSAQVATSGPNGRQRANPEGSRSAVDSIAQQKEVEFYAALANGWVATRMEYDKNLVTLSAGGIGLFVTLLTTIGVRSWWEGLFYVVGASGFVGAITVGLKIFLRNADFFQELVAGRGLEGDPVLKRLDRWLVRLFLVGAAGALLAGASAAFSKYHDKEKVVSDDSKHCGKESESKKPAAAPQSQPVPPSKGRDSLNESMNGIQRMRPDTNNISIHSMDGVQRLRPMTNTPVPPPAPEQKTQPPAPKKP